MSWQRFVQLVRQCAVPLKILQAVSCVCRIRDDEAEHVDSMRDCQEPDVRARARIVELGAIATAAAVFATSALTVETVETVESVAAPAVQRVEMQVADELVAVERGIEREVQAAEAIFEEALEEAAMGSNSWRPAN